MLVLARKIGQTFMINDDINITVLAMRGNQVRIGVNAPENVGIYREEIYRSVKQNESNEGEAA